MGDAAYVKALRAIFAANDPDDGIDRSEGFGREVWVESLKPVSDGPYRELEVMYGLTVPDRPRFRDVPSRGCMRVPIEPEWLELSGYADVGRFARTIASRVWSDASSLVQRILERDRTGTIERAAVEAVLPVREVLWTLLLEQLASYGSVNQVGTGRIELLVDEGGKSQLLTLLVNADAWYDYVVEAEIGSRLDRGVDAARDGQGVSRAASGLEEAIDSRHLDDRFVIYDHGRFTASIREKPPLIGGSSRPTAMLE